MTTNPTDLAAALNECMPLMLDAETYTRAVSSGGHLYIHDDVNRVSRGADDARIIGILWAECVRRGWEVSVRRDSVAVSLIPEPSKLWRHCIRSGTDALAFARAFAAAKRADGECGGGGISGVTSAGSTYAGGTGGQGGIDVVQDGTDAPAFARGLTASKRAEGGEA